MIFLAQEQAALAGLEEDLDIPAVPVDPNDVLLAQFHIGADDGNPVLAVVPITQANDTCINGVLSILVLSDLDGDGKKILKKLKSPISCDVADTRRLFFCAAAHDPREIVRINFQTAKQFFVLPF